MAPPSVTLHPGVWIWVYAWMVVVMVVFHSVLRMHITTIVQSEGLIDVSIAQ